MNTEHASTENSLQALIDQAPDVVTPEEFVPNTVREIWYKTGMPKRYRADWPRPTDPEWIARLSKLNERMRDGGLVALIGTRGTGKTRLAAESMRDVCSVHGHYTTAMGLFLRIRSTYGKQAAETEEGVIKELSKCPMLILDEVQERGNTPWEDRLLTHIIDKRYGAMRPTIIIANLAEQDFRQSLSDSIVSRLFETGGIMELTGPSFRTGDAPTPPKQQNLNLGKQ
jgi:DNA replication protein DnaC